MSAIGRGATNISGCMLLDVLDPRLDILKRLLICDVVHKKDALQ